MLSNTGEKYSGPPTPGSSPVSDTRFSSNFRRKIQGSSRCPPTVLSHAQLSEDFRKKLGENYRIVYIKRIKLKLI